MKINEDAECEVDLICQGLREIVAKLEAVGEDDCTHREWKEKDAKLRRARAALKALARKSTDAQVEHAPYRNPTETAH